MSCLVLKICSLAGVLSFWNTQLPLFQWRGFRCTAFAFKLDSGFSAGISFYQSALIQTVFIGQMTVTL